MSPSSSTKPEHSLGKDAEEITMPLEQVKNFLPVGWFDLVDKEVWTAPTTYGVQDFSQHPFFQIPEESGKRSAEDEEADMEMEQDIDGESKSSHPSRKASNRVYKK